MKIKQIKTAKGRDGIEINKFRYRKDKNLATGEINWRCTNRKCSASLKTNHAVNSINSKPTPHNHDPPDTPTSVPSTPTSQTPLHTPFRIATEPTPSETSLSLEAQAPSLTELLLPYITLTPDPPKFSKLDEENTYLRQRVAELIYINSALTDKLIKLEKQLVELKQPENLAVSSVKGVYVREADGGDVIGGLKGDSSVAFSHTISGDSANWYKLPDDDIKLYLDQINKPTNMLVLEPAVSHLLKNQTGEDAKNLLHDLKIDTYDYVLAPVNDRSDDSKEGGTHWSLLLYARDTDTYYHLDSLEPLNNKHAERLAALLSGDPCTSVVRLKCCRQKLSVECGAYVLHFVDLVCSLIRNNLTVQDDRCYTQTFSVNNIYAAIKRIKKSKTIGKNFAKSKIVLLSDSHGRDLGRLLQRKLERKSVVSSVVKPNATLEMVTSGLVSEALKLGSDDHLVILGGTNNVSYKSEFNIKHCVQEIAARTKHTNVILCTVPLRYDRPDLNRKIRKINIDLIMEALKYDHLKVVSLSNIPAKNYTSKGIHFNKWGKEKLCFSVINKLHELHLN